MFLSVLESIITPSWKLLYSAGIEEVIISIILSYCPSKSPTLGFIIMLKFAFLFTNSAIVEFKVLEALTGSITGEILFNSCGKREHNSLKAINSNCLPLKYGKYIFCCFD